MTRLTTMWRQIWTGAQSMAVLAICAGTCMVLPVALTAIGLQSL